MGGIKPIGSERLEGINKLRRIMEIARYKENIPQKVNETKSTEYSINLADGNVYRIEKERQGYIIKLAINESESEYIEPMKARRYYSAYSQALKRLNLMTKEINVIHENEEGTSLIGEQKKKFVLKTKKKKESDEGGDTPPPPPADMGATPPPPADMGAGGPPADMGATPPPPADMGATPPPPADMGATPPADMGAGGPPADMGAGGPPADMGAEMPTDMGSEMPTDMGGEESGEMPTEIESEEEIDVEEKPKEKKVSDLKRIQILVGKLAQKIRSYEEEKNLSNKEIKYIINSILSAIDVDVLDEDDIEQIISKLEGTEEEEGEEEMSFEEEDTEVEPGVAPEPPQEPEMTEGYPKFVDAFNDYMGGALASGMSKKLTHEDTSEFDDDEYGRERRKGRKHYPNVDRFEHGTFAESKVDKLLSKYFVFTEGDFKKTKIKEERKSNSFYKIDKQNIVRLSESEEQMDMALDFLRENPSVKFMGLSTKGNLVFKQGINEVKITRSGRVL
jgi:hypothetical protein